MSKSAVGLGIGLVLALVLPILLILGSESVDQLEPEREQALMFYGATIFLFLAGFALAWSLPGAPRLAQMSWTLLGTIIGIFLATIMEDYPYTWVELAMPFGIGAAIAVLITWLVAENGDKLARMIGCAAGFAFFIAAAYHTMTIERQVEMAAQAHRDAPGLGFIVVLALGFVHNIARGRSEKK